MKKCRQCKRLISKDRDFYCSDYCRQKYYNKKYSAYHSKWQKDRRDKEAEKQTAFKVQCLICGKWYIQVCSHAIQAHKISGRNYREHFDLEVKRGIVPKWYRKWKGDQALDNGTYKNLKKGKKYYFVKGDKRAGNYKRSHITIERLKLLYKYKKN